MRDRRWVAEHRGGRLKREQHRQLMRWAIECAEHILPLSGSDTDQCLKHALSVAKKWERGKVPTGDAMKAARSVHAFARGLDDPVSIAVARAVGHAVGTAHAADHSMGPALYSMKALRSAGKSLEDEREWQVKRLPLEVKELVLSSLAVKERGFKIVVESSKGDKEADEHGDDGRS